MLHELTDEECGREKILQKEFSEEQVNDVYKAKEDDAYTFMHGVATSGVCDWYDVRPKRKSAALLSAHKKSAHHKHDKA